LRSFVPSLYLLFSLYTYESTSSPSTVHTSCPGTVRCTGPPSSYRIFRSRWPWQTVAHWHTGTPPQSSSPLRLGRDTIVNSWPPEDRITNFELRLSKTSHSSSQQATSSLYASIINKTHLEISKQIYSLKQFLNLKTSSTQPRRTAYYLLEQSRRIELPFPENLSTLNNSNNSNSHARLTTQWHEFRSPSTFSRPG
jgi:hypothetical protein